MRTRADDVTSSESTVRSLCHRVAMVVFVLVSAGRSITGCRHFSSGAPAVLSDVLRSRVLSRDVTTRTLTDFEVAVTRAARQNGRHVREDASASSPNSKCQPQEPHQARGHPCISEVLCRRSADAAILDAMLTACGARGAPGASEATRSARVDAAEDRGVSLNGDFDR